MNVKTAIAIAALCGVCVSFAGARGDDVPIRITAQAGTASFAGTIEVTVTNDSGKRVLFSQAHGYGWVPGATLYAIDNAGRKWAIYPNAKTILNGSGGMVVVEPGASQTMRLRVPDGLLSADFKAYVLSMDAGGGATVYSAPFQIPAAK